MVAVIELWLSKQKRLQSDPWKNPVCYFFEPQNSSVKRFAQEVTFTKSLSKCYLTKHLSKVCLTKHLSNIN